MSVYISGLKIPQDGRVTLQIDSNGGVYVVNKFSIASEKYEKSMTATEIQPHGRLGDLDVLTEDLAIYRGGHSEGWGYDGGMYEAYNNSLMLVEDAPTVIEAERSET